MSAKVNKRAIHIPFWLCTTQIRKFIYQWREEQRQFEQGGKPIWWLSLFTIVRSIRWTHRHIIYYMPMGGPNRTWTDKTCQLQYICAVFEFGPYFRPEFGTWIRYMNSVHLDHVWFTLDQGDHLFSLIFNKLSLTQILPAWWGEIVWDSHSEWWPVIKTHSDHQSTPDHVLGAVLKLKEAGKVSQWITIPVTIWSKTLTQYIIRVKLHLLANSKLVALSTI